MSFDDTTNCTEFSKYGRFNPYSILHEKWVVFFYWAEPQPLTTYIFTFPTANHTKNLKKILDGNTILPVTWSARQILMEDHRNVVTLLVERADRGEFWRYPLYRVTGSHKITPRDVRLKQTGDNRLIGFMDCADGTMFAMARMNDVPPKNRLADEAARLGFKGRRGKSYLYQGHEWLPIPEDDERNYWHYPKKNKEQEKSSNKVQESSKEESEETNKPEETEQKDNSDDDNKLFSEKHIEPNCVKIEPELWNDPKPDPIKTENKISIEDLHKLDENETINNENTLLNELYNTTSNKRETILEKNAENVENMKNSSITSNIKPQKVTINNVEVKKSDEIKDDKGHKDNKVIYKKTDNTKSEVKETEEKKVEEKKTEESKAEGKKVDKGEENTIKADDKKTEGKKTNNEQAKEKKTDNKEIENTNSKDNKAEQTKVEKIKAQDKKAKKKKLEVNKSEGKKVKQSEEKEDENCNVCYDSSPSMYTTSEPYTPSDAPHGKTERGLEKNLVSPNIETSTEIKGTTKLSNEKPLIIVNNEDNVITIKPVPLTTI
ncbi:uncharacterized protein DDB_G0286299-like [Spodoptera litura]|uniref:Uncharacterized protein DDB_G0286299-like n=1 Tax=Spodoptera litura TaxID=69820 RepID=A0A9J7EIV9_SPOLT|nr:uncharacterized protein DDB_G0286299-like [Spodoptera litura]